MKSSATKGSYIRTFAIVAAMWCAPIVAVADYDLLIIAPREFSEALQPLRDHKTATGMPARISNLESIYYTYRSDDYYDNPERIKRAIYDKWVSDDIKYVMLVGDGTKFPFRFTFGDIYDKGDDRWWDPTDYYYADIANDAGDFNDWDWNGNNVFGEIYVEHVNQDEIDFHPEVAVGRIPAGNVEEVRNYVVKVIRHEYRPHGNAWFRKATYSSTEDPPWENPSMSAIFDNIENSLHAADARFSHERLVGHGSGEMNTNFDNLRTTFENGVGFLFHHGHGSPSEFQEGILSSRRIRDDIGFDLYRHPIIFASSCSTARLSPYVPIGKHGVGYWTKDGYEHLIPSGSVGFASPHDVPEPAPIQVDPDTGTIYGFTNNIGKQFVVGEEGGAIAYVGCVQTGENEGLILGRGFFESYSTDFPFPEQIHLGEMWKGAIAHFAGIFDLHRYDHDTTSDGWRVRASFHVPCRFTLFGDPSLRVGGYAWELLDNTPPVTTHGLDPDRYYNDELVVELDAVDEDSGVHHTEISVRDHRTGDYEEIVGKVFDFDGIPSDAVSRYTLSYRSIDILENEEEWNGVTLQFDTVLPDPVSIDIDGPPSAIAGYHYADEVTIDFETSDADSGIARIDYVISRDTGAVIPEVFELGSVDNPSDSTGDFSTSFTFDHSGQFRLVAFAVDRAGNRSISRTSNFSIRLLDRREWMSDLVDILRGQHMFELAPELGLPFDASSMEFELDLPVRGWTLVARDEIAKDGWTFEWNTQKYNDGVYRARAVAREGVKAHAVDLGNWGLLNLSAASYAFSLSAEQESADRAEPVPYSITFENKGSEVLSNPEIAFQVGNGQFDMNSLRILNGGAVKSIENRTVIEWAGSPLKPGQSWTVRFEAAAAEIPSGDHTAGLAYFRCDQIPVIRSDDPSTKGDLNDATKVLVMANDGIIEGSVRDKFFLKPLAELSVSLDDGEKSVTGGKGEFRFEGVPAGVHRITVAGGRLYENTEASVKVDGDTARVELLVSRLDLSPPHVYLAQPFLTYVEEGVTTFTGSAVDNEGGSGMAAVEIGILRLSDGQFWDGAAWGTSTKMFPATGTDTWSHTFSGLKFDSQQTYGLKLRAVDKNGNVGVMDAESRPPVPTGLRIDFDGKYTVLSWNGLPGHGFLVELSDRSDFSRQLIYEYVDESRFVLPEGLGDGRYYWRVATTAGINLLSDISGRAQFTVGTVTDAFQIVSVTRDPENGDVSLSWNPVIKNGLVEFSADLTSWKTLAEGVSGENWTGVIPGNPSEAYLRVRGTPAE